jgi:hypothetical protein
MAEEMGQLLNERDWYLQLFIAMAETMETGIPVTLSVRGILVTGTPISSKKYFDGVAKLVSEAFAKAGFLPDNIKTITESLALPGKQMEEIAKDETTSPSTYTYIHLENARFYSPSGVPWTQPGTLWRGKVSSVDGFYFGGLDPTS